MTILKFKVMGTPRLWAGEEEITKELSKKAMALVSYLLFAPNQCVPREQLMTLLWGESDEKAARYNLRHNLWKIRRVMRVNHLADDWLEADNQFVRIVNKQFAEVDAYHLMQLHQQGDSCQWQLTTEALKELLTLYNADFFDHFYLSDCEDFNDWIYFKREEFQRLYIQCLTETAKAYEVKGELDVAIDLYKELTGFMPYDDQVHLCLIKSLYEVGDLFNAIRYYEKHRNQLRTDLNVNPSRELQVYVDSIQKKQSKAIPNKNVWNGRLVLENHALEEVPYMTLAYVIDQIINRYSQNELMVFDDYAWSDLSRINGSIRKFLDVAKYPLGTLTESSERIRIFKAMYDLLMYFNAQHNLVLDFKKLTKLDCYSDEFFNNLYKTDQGNIMKNWL